MLGSLLIKLQTFRLRHLYRTPPIAASEGVLFSLGGEIMHSFVKQKSQINVLKHDVKQEHDEDGSRKSPLCFVFCSDLVLVYSKMQKI